MTEAQYSTCAGVRAAITEAETIRELRLHVQPTSSNPPLSPQQLRDQGFLTGDSSIVCPAGGTLEWVTPDGGVSWSFVCSIHSAVFVYNGTTNGITSLNGGGIAVSGGSLRFTNPSDENRVAFGQLSWTDYTVHVRATLASGNGYGIYYRSDGKAGYSPGITGYCFQFDPGLGNRLVVRKVVNGSEQDPFQSVAMSASIVAALHGPHDISVAGKGDHHVISVDGVGILDFHDNTFKPLLKKAKLPSIRFHDLRHTSATLLLSADSGTPSSPPFDSLVARLTESGWNMRRANAGQILSYRDHLC